jgi:uncharacterized protein with HEPN domain
MSKRGEREYLADIREAIQRIGQYTTGLSYGRSSSQTAKPRTRSFGISKYSERP